MQCCTCLSLCVPSPRRPRRHPSAAGLLPELVGCFCFATACSCPSAGGWSCSRPTTRPCQPRACCRCCCRSRCDFALVRSGPRAYLPMCLPTLVQSGLPVFVLCTVRACANASIRCQPQPAWAMCQAARPRRAMPCLPKHGTAPAPLQTAPKGWLDHLMTLPGWQITQGNFGSKTLLRRVS